MRSDALRPALILAGALLLAYAGSWHGVFQFDDFNVIVGADQVHSLGAWIHGLGHGLRPLLKLTYLLNWSIDPQPFGFHLFNLLVHASCTGMVYLLARLFGESHDTQRDWHWVAWFSAAGFALHPAHTEAVTYLSGRATALMTLFYLATLYVYARGWRRLAMVGFVLAVLVKESAMLLPAALLLWEGLAGTPWRLIVRRQWPWWLLTALAALALLAQPGYRSLIDNSVTLRDSASAMLTQLHAAGYLLGQWVWPSRLNIDPELPLVSDPAAVWREGVLALLLMVLAWRCRRRRPWISLGIGWLLLHLWLFNALFPRTDIANERLLYWADWALFFALATEAQSRLPQRWFVGMGVVLLLALGARCFERNQVYRSEIALWTDTAGKSPGKARVWNNLGYALAEAGDQARAERAYRQALRLDPDYVKARNNLRRVRRKDGRRQKGENRRPGERRDPVPHNAADPPLGPGLTSSAVESRRGDAPFCLPSSVRCPLNLVDARIGNGHNFRSCQRP